MSKPFPLSEKLEFLQQAEEYLSKPDADLEEGIVRYEQVVKVAAEIAEYLEQTEQRIEELQAKDLPSLSEK